MGSTSYHRPPGQSDRDHLQAELFDGTPSTIIDSATIGGTFYAAVQTSDHGVWGLVVLQWRQPRSHYNYTRKEISEDMGPGYHDCPARILDRLTPTDSEYAQEWRAKCREVAARKAAAAKVKPGDVIRFDTTMHFGSGYSTDTLTFEGRSTFRARPGWRCRVPNWRTRAFTVVTEGA